MVNKKLVDYVNSATEAGQSAEQIRSALLKIGWPENEVDEVLNSNIKSPTLKRKAKAEPEKVEPEKHELEKKKKHKKIYIAGIIIILAIVGITGYYVLSILPMTQEQQLSVTCGNNVCNTGETYDNCPKDCPQTQGTGSQTVSVSPAAQTAIKGSDVTVEIRIAGASNLFGFQFDLEYDPNVLQYKELSEGTFLSKNKADSTYCVPPKIESGLIKNMACTRLGAIGGLDGDGILETFKFTALNSGMSYIRLVNVKLADSSAQKMDFKSENGQVNVS